MKGKDGANGLNGKDGANGKDGTGIQSATINNNGELIVTLDDGTIINAGQVVAPEKRLDENNQITCKTFEKTDKTIYGKVTNVTETFYFTDEIELKGGASYSVYTDFDCSNEIISKVVKLNVGDNTFYILEKCGNDSKFYTVTIRRREIYTVSFAVNDGTPLENSTIKVEEDSLVPKDSVPSSPRDGYDLVWDDNDFTSPITENTIITATLTAIYSVSENTITGLTDYGESLIVLNIPSVIDGKSVTSIGRSAFEGCSGLASVTIPDSVTSIGSSAFSGCTGLTSITIPDSVTSIGQQAFRNCTGLTSVTIGNSVTSIGSSAFSGCSGLTGITIPNSVTSIGWSAFSGCSGLTSITIPDSVTSIDITAFSGCIGLTSVTIPNSVTSIGEAAFNGCSKLQNIYITDIVAWCNISGLYYLMAYGTSNMKLYINNELATSITIPDSVTSIGGGAFYGCTGLTSITIPDSVTSIGYDAFAGCSGLTSVTVPESVTSIGFGAFSGCSKLTNITIPDSVTRISDQTFYGCTGLTSVTIGNGVTSIGRDAFSGCSGLTSVTIGNGVTSIGDFAFYGCDKLQDIYITDIAAWCNISGLGNLMYYGSNNKKLYINNELATSITIPNSVTRIGNYAFSGCTGLTSVTIPNSVTSIGNYAFYNCTGLTSVVIPDSVTSIGRSAFEGCTGLTSITIPDSVTSIGESAFYNTAWYNNQPNGLVYADKVAYKYKGVMPSNTSIVLKEGTLGIGDYAFEGCSGLTSITIPDSVMNIGSGAFRGCTGLTSITIPNSVTSIGVQTFSYCSGLTSITIPDSVTSIGNYAFSRCTGLASITIGNSVTSIGVNAFYDTAWYNNQPDGLVYAGKVAYRYKGTMPSNTSIELKEGTLGIGDYAFSGCERLTSITIPNSVTSIDDWAFSACYCLTTVFYAGTEEQWNAIAFGQNIGISSSILYYYSETEPALNSDGTGYAGNYWHYDADGNVAIWKKEN